MHIKELILLAALLITGNTLAIDESRGDPLCEIEGQIHTNCGTACPPTCTHPKQFCVAQCVMGCQCPTGFVLDEKAAKCVKVEHCSECPPDCTKDFCTSDENKNALCKMPGPREIPGCTGQCQLTYCGACYFDDEVRPLPNSCKDCGSPISDLRCLETWAQCIHKADININGEPVPKSITQENFKCYRYPCMLRG